MRLISQLRPIENCQLLFVNSIKVSHIILSKSSQGLKINFVLLGSGVHVRTDRKRVPWLAQIHTKQSASIFDNRFGDPLPLQLISKNHFF